MTFEPPAFNRLHPALREKWGWFVGIGGVAALGGLAALALVETATIVSVSLIGMLMIAIGAAELIIGLKARSWGRAIYWEIAGLVYIVAGGFAIAEPVPATVVITLILGAGLLATGIVRVIAGLRSHMSPVRHPLLLGGAVTALLGLIIVLGWPSNSLLVIGTLLGIDLLFNGISWIVFGLRLRSAS